jgi:DDE family transposase
MCSVSRHHARQMEEALCTVARTHARSSGYCQRRSKLTAEVFCTTVVLGWLQHPDAGGGTLAAFAAVQGVRISPQGLLDRFTPAAAALLLTVLRAVLAEEDAEGQSCPLPLLERFTRVVVEDSSTVALPDELGSVWQGCGGNRSGHGGLKLQAQVDLRHGDLAGLWLTAGRSPDRASPGIDQASPAGSMRIADLGYFILDRLQAEHAADCYWLTRLHPQAGVTPDGGEVLQGEDLTTWLAAGPAGPQDHRIELGVTHRLPCRLIALPRTPEATERIRRQLRKVARRKQQPASPASLARAGWDLLVTNEQTLTIPEIRALYAARWQIEILWRSWKSDGRLSRWRSQSPWRILCEVYAKLIGLVFLHRILAQGVWQVPAKSLMHAGRLVRDHAITFARELGHPRRLARTIADLLTALPGTAPTATHATHPATFQRLRRASALP